MVSVHNITMQSLRRAAPTLISSSTAKPAALAFDLDIGTTSVLPPPPFPSLPPPKRQKRCIVPQLATSTASSSLDPPPHPAFLTSCVTREPTLGQLQFMQHVAEMEVRFRELESAMGIISTPPPANSPANPASTYSVPVSALPSSPVFSPLSSPSEPFGFDCVAAPVDHVDPGAFFKIDYFVFVGDDSEGVEWALVQWSLGDRTWQTTESLREDCETNELEQLLSMAFRVGDSAASVELKFDSQQLYLRTHPNATTRSQARMLYSMRFGRGITTPPSSASSSTSSFSPQSSAPSSAASTAKPSPSPQPPPSTSSVLLLLRCSICAQRSPGSDCSGDTSAFVCFHCRRTYAKPCERVRQYGVPRPTSVKVAVSGEREFVHHVRASPMIDHVAEQAVDVDIAVCSYHEEGRSAEDHVNQVSSCWQGERDPSLVLVLSCWRNPNAQTAALRQLATRHPHTTFITFRAPNLVPVECFDTAIGHLMDIIVFPNAPQPLIFLSNLCTIRSDCIVFTHCGMPVPRPALQGPLRIVTRSAAGVALCACGSKYERSVKPWKRGLKSVSRWRCAALVKRAAGGKDTAESAKLSDAECDEVSVDCVDLVVAVCN